MVENEVTSRIFYLLNARICCQRGKWYPANAYWIINLQLWLITSTWEKIKRSNSIKKFHDISIIVFFSHHELTQLWFFFIYTLIFIVFHRIFSSKWSHGRILIQNPQRITQWENRHKTQFASKIPILKQQ